MTATKYLVEWNIFYMNSIQEVRYFTTDSKNEIDQFLKRNWHTLCVMQGKEDVPWTYYNFETGKDDIPIQVQHGKVIYLPKIYRDNGPKRWLSASFIIVETTSSNNIWIRDLGDEDSDDDL
jgi:hypothetical protein